MYYQFVEYEKIILKRHVDTNFIIDLLNILFCV